MMPELPPLVLAALTGFISGLLLSMPIGPVNLTLINGAAQGGFARAMLIGLGAATMDVIYCSIAFTGFSSLFTGHMVKASMEVFSFAFMLFLGMKFLKAKTVMAPTQLGAAAEKIEARIGEKWQPHSAFMTGFMRVLGNLGVLLFWIVLAANFVSRDWVENTLPSKLACIAGVAVGANAWFFTLSYTTSLGHGRFSERTLIRMEQFSGICLIMLGFANGAHIAWQLAKHKL